MKNKNEKQDSPKQMNNQEFDGSKSEYQNFTNKGGMPKEIKGNISSFDNEIDTNPEYQNINQDKTPALPVNHYNFFDDYKKDLTGESNEQE